ncbi:MAG TPA: aminopeptidase [Gaiella sp.]|jgi:aminopeptidase
MSAHADRARRLAELAVRFGANVQPAQVVAVTSYVGKEELTRAIARVAYEAGARWVDVVVMDDLVKRERLALAPEDSLEFVPPWMSERLRWLSDERAARITLSGPQAPGAFDDVDPARAGRDLLPWLPESSEVINARTTNWTIVPGPTVEWARAVYADAAPDEALDRLWAAVEHMCRLDADDPVAAWTERMDELAGAARRLTERRFDAIRLHGPGTDLTIGLLPSSEWQAADFERCDGLVHHPNLPTEEVFTTPDPQRADGVVTMTMPRELYGAIVDGIRIEFSGGRAVRIDAERGAETLRAAASKDDGASRLGELALVDGGGRIGPLETVFLDTLIDENAASHIALGSGLAMGLSDPADVERMATSEIHVDLMVGSPDVDVDGVTATGERVPVLRRGAWQV